MDMKERQRYLDHYTDDVKNYLALKAVDGSRNILDPLAVKLAEAKKLDSEALLDECEKILLLRIGHIKAES